jgi:7,8-dihydropterin-6-yl-methyl-4-(beta-D-ribofuranosyl)aminobenzene 5'-phosphate synthase
MEQEKPVRKDPKVQPVDIGVCKSLRIRCISETAWFDTARILEDIKQAGGPETNQYGVHWDHKNSGGYSALIEVEALDGTRRRFLLDTGWNPAWMEYSFQREGIDDLLRRKDIEFLYVSHEHMDHFWGLPVTLKYDPHITLMISRGYYPEGKELIQKSGHKGELIELGAGRINPLFPGCASITYDIPIMIRVHGEHGLFFNVQDKGLVGVTGCCHMGVLNMMQYASENIQGGDRLYGLYGGLHIAPFEQWDPKLDEIISGLAAMNMQKVAANHCTGLITIQKMLAAGLPVVKGTAKYGSRSDLYLGNGDEIVF